MNLSFFFYDRTRRDNFENVVGRGVVPRDPYPQWRQVSWSPDNTMVACSRSNGTVDVFDIVGTQLFTISGVSNYRQGDDNISLSYKYLEYLNHSL